MWGLRQETQQQRGIGAIRLPEHRLRTLGDTCCGLAAVSEVIAESLWDTDVRLLMVLG